MDKIMKIFTKIAAVLFAVMALLHAARLLFGWQVIFAGINVPLWVNAIGVVLASVIAIGLWREAKS